VGVYDSHRQIAGAMASPHKRPCVAGTLGAPTCTQVGEYLAGREIL
jgi:hypothetical protein